MTLEIAVLGTIAIVLTLNAILRTCYYYRTKRIFNEIGRRHGIEGPK